MAKTPARQLEYMKRYHLKNKDKACEKSREWYAKNKERVRNDPRRKARDADYESARRARQRAAFVEHVDRIVVFDRDEGICGICEQAIGGEFHLDHIIPLSRGGLHCYDNIQITHPSCNLKKYNKMEGGDAK